MIESVLRQTFALFTPDGGAPFEGYQYVNYKAEVDRAMAKAASAQEDQSQRIIVVFGYPGNGKRAFSQEVSRRLHSQGYYVLWLDVFSVIEASEERLTEDCLALRETLLSMKQRPLLFVVDGLDLLKPSLRENPALVRVRDIVLLCSTERCAPNTLVVATAQSPDTAINEFGPVDLPSLQFFNWPDPTRAVEFFRLLEVPNAEAVVGYVFAYSRNERLRYTASSLISGAKQALRILASSPDGAEIDALGREEISPEKLASMITTFCTPTPEDEVRRYLIENESFIARAI